MILSKAQRLQILAAVHSSGQYVSLASDVTCADGLWFEILAQYSPPQYYDAVVGTWSKTVPVGQGHVTNYPFPLPFVSPFQEDPQHPGMPLLNKYALMLPMKYQMYNMANMTRTFVTDFMFLNEWAIPQADITARRSYFT